MCRGIRESERHNKPLKRTPFRLEGSFVDIFLRDADLVKARSQVHFGKEPGAFHPVYGVIHAWCGINVFDGDGI